MGSIGEILARRAAVTGASLRPRRVPLGSHSGAAHGQDGCESPTAAVTDSEKLRAMALLRGIKPLPVPEPDETDRDAFPGLGVSHGLEDARGLDGSLGLEDARGLDGSLGLEDARGIEGALADSVEALESLRSCTVAGALSFGFAEAAGFAGRVEEISRTVEYLQVIAAHAVERTRTQAQQARPSTAGTGWQTGWTDPATTDSGTTDPAAPAPGPNPATATAARTAVGGSAAAGFATAGGFDAAGGFATAAGFDAAGGSATAAGFGGVAAADAAAVADDGYRDAAQFLRARLRIGISEARRRLALASEVLPRTGIAGQHIPARREILAQALESTQIPTRSASIISAALDKVRLLTDEETLTRMEHALTATAIESDPDFVLKMTKRWNDLIDQDGPEPSEEILRQLQGTFIRKPRHGLHHLEIFATTEQYETLTTAMNTATNPRLTPAHNPATDEAEATGESNATDEAEATGESNATGESHESTDGNGDSNESTDGNNPAGPELDRRSRAQKLLDGLVGACAVAMTTGKLPSNGGLRPQLTVTINERDLFERLTRTAPTPSTATPAGAATTTPPGTQTTGPGPHGSRFSSGAATRTTGPGPHHSRLSSGTATFAGPIHPNTIRKIACDADILPVLLGTDSRILDIGRTTRIFPPHIRKAITARDQGCAFPDCTMPAPWCEAHHITYWSHGGTTSTDNGTLLCSHHHHLIHKENWTITTTTAVPWFTPPPHIDPKQTPRRNHHHTPLRT
ncbi:HNH endonuclease signature motif containing protein [Paenarthrobacter aromaticivorans]|uniref:HNH endonuclease signature motif containing protein n=1 Tax=Paenarthrobacter aromaticivorans TaxID=2849150 RepID=UPI003A80D062